MTEDRKNELAAICRLEIRRTVTLAKMALADYGYHLVMSVFDAEFQSMLDRCSDKPFDEHDIPLLMELVMEDLWPRLREAHRRHRDHVFDSIKKTYRDTISEDASFAFDIGWRTLLQSAADRIETYPSAWKATITGGKEKLGCCVIYIGFDDAQPGARSEIERLREEVRLRSLASCDICGQQGRLRLSSIAKTVCDRHAAVLGDLRDDDGRQADPWRWRDDAADPLRETALGERIDDDTWIKRGREQELLIEFNGAIEDAVAGAVVREEYLDDYIAKELDGWRTTAVVPLSDRDRKFLHAYVRELIDAEYERVRQKREAERDTN